MSLREPRLSAEEDPDDPDTYEVWLDGEVIFTTNYDEIGSAGLHAIQKLCDELTTRLGDNPNV